ncbi:unnamed protein product [Gulo gulo]|uniref:Uncharacterized protein n=1 Tax=Gulo gulo TaxID=48420 RepID=A0A9X9LP55_GULGU|nr:unnamed protein product [Gulo gulo]
MTKGSHLRVPPHMGKSSSDFLLIGLVFLLKDGTFLKFYLDSIPISPCYMS